MFCQKQKHLVHDNPNKIAIQVDTASRGKPLSVTYLKRVKVCGTGPRFTMHGTSPHRWYPFETTTCRRAKFCFRMARSCSCRHSSMNFLRIRDRFACSRFRSCTVLTVGHGRREKIRPALETGHGCFSALWIRRAIGTRRGRGTGIRTSRNFWDMTHTC